MDNVRVRSHAGPTGPIIMGGVSIGRHARIRRTIIDKGVTVPAGMGIGFNLIEEGKRFTITDTDIVVIPKGVRL